MNAEFVPFAIGLVVICSVAAAVLIGRELRARQPPLLNPPAPRAKPIGGYTIVGKWPFNKGDRARLLVAVPEYGTEIGHAMTCIDVWPSDDTIFRFMLDGRSGRDAIITFYETELWQLERINK